MDQLTICYQDWLFSNVLSSQLGNFFSSPKLLFHQVKSCLERWIISVANVRLGTSIFSVDSQDLQEINQKLYQELLEKNVIEDKARRFVEKITENLFQYQQGVIEPVNVKPKLLVNVTYKNYSDYYPPERLKLLSQINRDPKKLLSVCLRYSSLMMSGQQFSIPQSFANSLYQYLEINNEGFASPFNSKFLDKPDGYYCSLFPDLEKYFKSQGDFFETELNGNWEINPPFIESIIEKTVDRVIEQLTTTDHCQTFVIILPNWPDSIGFQKLRNLSCPDYLKREEIKPKGYYHYETAYGEKIRANFDTVIFFISNDQRVTSERIQLCLDSWN